MTRILVVDDEIQIRRALDINLRAHGYDVVLAATVEAGGGPDSQLTTGDMASNSQDVVTVGDVKPSLSLARTESWWSPSVSTGGLKGLKHDAQGPASTLQAYVLSGVFDEKMNGSAAVLAERSVVAPAVPTDTVGVRTSRSSTVKPLPPRSALPDRYANRPGVPALCRLARKGRVRDARALAWIRPGCP